MPNGQPKQLANLKPFKIGTGKDRDPRIRAHGRPKSFDVLRKLAQRIAAEPIAEKNGYTVTRIEAMLLAMSSSKNPSDRRAFLEYAYGKVKDEIDMTSKGEKIGSDITDERFNRAMSTLSETIRESISGQGTEQDGSLVSTE